MRAEDKRKETRVRSRGRLNLIVEGAAPISAKISDVSVTGLCVEAEEALPSGVAVRLDSVGFTAHGIVRYCGREQGGYRIGIALEPPLAN